MRFSIFDDDSTLGATAGMRPVVLRGTVTVSGMFSPNFFNIAEWIKTALRNNGFDVVNVRTTSAAWIGYTTNIEIELNVFNEFTGDEARRNAIAAIEDYTANFGLNKVFHNTTLSVAYDGYQAPSGSNPKPSTNPPSSYDHQSGTDTGSGFVENFAMGLGVSTPVAALIGIGALIVILRR